MKHYKTDCKIIEDLIPLYLDGVCSDESRKVVEDHLKGCGKCRSFIGSAPEINAWQFAPENVRAEDAVKKAFKKIRFRWWASILAIFLIISTVVIVWKLNGGSELHDIMQTGNDFMECIDNGDYEKAFGYVNIKGIKDRWRKEWFDDDKLKNIEEDAFFKFCEYGKNLEECGGIRGYEYVGISLYAEKDNGLPVYNMIFRIKYAGKEETLFNIAVSHDGVEYFSGDGSFVTDPLTKFSIWSEYLWQDYKGCYFDPESKEYVYYDEKE